MQNAKNITILSAFGDNYIYLLEYLPGQCFVVDPGVAKPVLDALEHLCLQLTHIFTTHHHADHIGGVNTLKQKTSCQVIGPDNKRIGELDTLMSDGDVIELGGVTIRCIGTPGHTATSVCYYVSSYSLAQPVLFTGDTLFVCGCGRMFECGGETMYASLQKLAALLDETLVYPGHDYTEENVLFALTTDPDNALLQEKLTLVRSQNKTGQPTVPSVLGEEKQINPFLLVMDWQTFTTLRRKKDSF
ncbi:MAG: hydroxyacylglutathione hydrolase [Planctomycetota bacterium]|jgi:hydroxyacylglutathione hydrolase